MVDEEEFFVFGAVFEHEDWVEDVLFVGDGYAVYEDVWVFEADDLVAGGEENSFWALDEVEIVVAGCDHVCVHDGDVVDVEDGGGCILAHWDLLQGQSTFGFHLGGHPIITTAYEIDIFVDLVLGDVAVTGNGQKLLLEFGNVSTLLFSHPLL